MKKILGYYVLKFSEYVDLLEKSKYAEETENSLKSRCHALADSYRESRKENAEREYKIKQYKDVMLKMKSEKERLKKEVAELTEANYRLSRIVAVQKEQTSANKAYEIELGEDA